MGEDKGLMSLFGKPMIEYILEKVKKISEDIIIVSANPNYEKFGYPLIVDQFKNKGPLAGIHAGLSKSEHAYNLVLSCDVPYVKEGLLKFIIYQSIGFDVTIPEHDSRLHPLIGVYHKKCIPHFEKAIIEGRLKVVKAINELNVNIVVTSEFDAVEFKNINSKKDIN